MNGGVADLPSKKRQPAKKKSATVASPRPFSLLAITICTLREITSHGQGPPFPLTMKWKFTLLYALTGATILFSDTLAFQCIHRRQQHHVSSSVLRRPTDFASTAPRTLRPQQMASRTVLFVFERMSEGSIAAVMAAQEQADKLQIPEVGTEVMMAGCINQPETKALERTLQKYRLTWRQAQRTLGEMYHPANSNDAQNQGWLSGFRAARDDDDRPFAAPLKQAFARAGRLADQMSSTQIQPQHIFLALLEYQETKDGKSAATVENGTCQAGGWAVLVKMNTFDTETVKALDVCQSLLDNMLDSAKSSDERELVTGLGPSGDTPTLAECGVDLTQQARDGLLDPVFGRDNEIRACLRTLIRRRKNNVCLTGEPGVGKTAIAEGVAQVLIDETACPARLKGHRLVSLELSTLVAGTKYRGEFEERLQAIIKEVTDPKAPPTILFIDEIHNLVGAGSAEGGMDAANMLKPALARGEMQIIGATTIMEYRKYIEKDAALERRLQPVTVKEPSVPETLSILQAVQTYYERHHEVSYTPEALEAMATLSDRYVNDRFLPDKALDLMDEAGALAHLESLGDEENLVVDEHLVASVISEWSGIPIGKLETSELDRLRSLEDDMERRVKGQGRAIRGVARAIRRARSGLRDPTRPIASFLFCGPTGTGKTELCKTLAETYFGSEKGIVRIDMSEYMEKHTVSTSIPSFRFVFLLVLVVCVS
jgi:ATP-dependent Clp protease ATP-binding subunit ClpC